MRPDGVPQSLAKLLCQFCGRPVPLLRFVRRPHVRECLDSNAPVLPDEQVPGWELATLAEDRQRAGNDVESEVRIERVQIDLATRKGPKLRREGELVARCAIVERLDAEAVAGEHEASFARVPDRDREHPAQELDEAFPLSLVQVRDDLRVPV